MADLSQLTDEELLKIAQGGVVAKPKDLSSYSDEELMQLAGVNKKPEEIPNLLTKPVETLVKSGGGFVGNIFSAIGHPIRTVKGITSVAKGGVEKLIPGQQADEKSFDALVGFYKQRYGSLEAAKKTALEDPVGFASDASMFLTGGGAAATKIGQISKAGRLLEVGQTASRIGRFVDPLQATTRGVGLLTKKATEGRRLGLFTNKIDQPVVTAAKEIGIELPASAISTSKAVPAIETLTSKGFFGEDIIQKVNKAQLSMNKYADDIIAQTGKAEDLSSAGQAIFKGADSFRNKFIEIKNELYKKALLPSGKKEKIILVNPTASKKFIKTILQDKERAANILGKSEDIGYFQNLEIGLSAEKIDARFLKSAINELNNKINNFNDPIAVGNKGTLKKLVTLISEDLDNAIAAQRPDLAKAINKANQFYSEGLSKLNSAYGEKIFEFAQNKQFDKILPAIINKNTSLEDIPRIFEIVGKENASAIQSAFLEEFFKGAKSADGNFSPSGITRQINKYGGENKVNAILTPEQFKVVKNLETVAIGLGKAEKIASGSQTAFIGRLLGETMTFFTNPILSLKIILGDALFSKFISSPQGQKFLTTGIELTGKTGRKILEIAPKTRIPGQLLRTGGIIEKQNQ